VQGTAYASATTSMKVAIRDMATNDQVEQRAAPMLAKLKGFAGASPPKTG